MRIKHHSHDRIIVSQTPLILPVFKGCVAIAGLIVAVAVLRPDLPLIGLLATFLAALLIAFAEMSSRASSFAFDASKGTLTMRHWQTGKTRVTRLPLDCVVSATAQITDDATGLSLVTQSAQGNAVHHLSPSAANSPRVAPIVDAINAWLSDHRR